MILTQKIHFASQILVLCRTVSKWIHKVCTYSVFLWVGILIFGQRSCFLGPRQLVLREVLPSRNPNEPYTPRDIQHPEHQTLKKCCTQHRITWSFNWPWFWFFLLLLFMPLVPVHVGNGHATNQQNTGDKCALIFWRCRYSALLI